MDFTNWKVDLNALSATHSSGFSLTIEGSPADPIAVNPGRFPDGLSAVEQARLLRMGLEALAKEAKDKPVKGYSASPSGSASVSKKPAYVAPANKPKRAKLSLKKKAETN